MQDTINKMVSKLPAEFLAKEACSIPFLKQIGTFCNTALEEVAEYVLKEKEKEIEGYHNLDSESICRNVGFHDGGKTNTLKTFLFPFR